MVAQQALSPHFSRFDPKTVKAHVSLCSQGTANTNANQQILASPQQHERHGSLVSAFTWAYFKRHFPGIKVPDGFVHSAQRAAVSLPQMGSRTFPVRQKVLCGKQNDVERIEKCLVSGIMISYKLLYAQESGSTPGKDAFFGRTSGVPFGTFLRA